MPARLGLWLRIFYRHYLCPAAYAKRQKKRQYVNARAHAASLRIAFELLAELSFIQIILSNAPGSPLSPVHCKAAAPAINLLCCRNYSLR
jgi:hypothetical protein